jgi:hypothetical protein
LEKTAPESAAFPSIVGRNRFIAPLGEADGIAPFGEADGAIKRLRPTTAPLSVELRHHPVHSQRVVAEAIWSDRSLPAFPNEQRLDHPDNSQTDQYPPPTAVDIM